ncbi:Uma2 family endonuclease [Picosynechococcus sp. NKBG042902]|uniref:Uma2 family endonuclease n=1 Tax=Picosynechococcus sp. NKBG042902 TaxID=490193 RepID=UPI0004AB43EC|nr:Uma2 family endonuclease [Picosynechococcus sp. NKBG042902]
MISTVPQLFTVEDYLEQEARSVLRHEFIQGKIIPMAGASANHNRLTLNLSRLLPFEISDHQYEIFVSDMRLWLPDVASYLYPDVMMIEGAPVFLDESQMAVTNPSMIAEVLSNSTEGFDKNQKFALYRTIPQLREYLLIDQTYPRVELYQKVGDRQWLLTELMGKNAVIKFKFTALEIKLSELYKRVSFVEK